MNIDKINYVANVNIDRHALIARLSMFCNQQIGCGLCDLHDFCFREERMFEQMSEEELLEAEKIAFATDQTAKSDAGKPKLTLVPRQIIFDIARIREYGNAKYPEGGPDNWKSVDIQRYRDAAFRHFMAYLDDPKGVDAESGLSNLAHLACNVAFLCELEKEE